ncbi:hypothetical protein Glove_37g113 [Diversispora epigaea]|uniref:Uncharacterized protein n=1 Tax=Diversispora epigaea TaxID=1348612 RepID=A0A397JIC6_9GLOM|nr:hypothetical protein Glove_37g113 [Diversispora epigaea]
MDPSPNIDLLDNIVKGLREMIIPGTPFKYKKIYTDCRNHDRNSRLDISKNLSKIVIPDANVKFETSKSDSHNFRMKLLSLNWKSQIKVQIDPSFIGMQHESSQNSTTSHLPTQRNRKKAFQIYFKVVDEVSLIAISKVGYYYEVGFGVKKNEKNAFELYLKSVDKGFQLQLPEKL